MTPQQTYLAWVRTNYPQVYKGALLKMTGQQRNLGGLGDDLTASLTNPDASLTSGTDPNSIAATTAAYFPSSVLTDPTTIANITLSQTTSSGSYDPTAAPSAVSSAPTVATGSSGVSDFFSAFTQGVQAIAQTASAALGVQAQSNLLAVNTARAQQGLPPLTAAGVPVTAASLAPTSASIAAMEQRIASTFGVSASSSPLFLIGLGVLAFMLLRKRSA